MIKKITWKDLKNLAANYKAAKGMAKEKFLLPYGIIRVYNEEKNEGFAVSDRNPIIAMNEILHWKDWD